MRHLVVFAHPRAESFNRQVLNTYVAALTRNGHEVRVRDLYVMNFNPVLNEAEMAAARTKGSPPADVQIEQDHVRWAEVITCISPVWWIGWPAILKGWIDRVFTLNFAYGYGPTGTVGLLAGKQAVVMGTTGSSAAHWQSSGKQEAMRVSQDVGTFEVSGMQTVAHLTFSPVGRLTQPAAFDAYLAEVQTLVDRHFAAGVSA